MTIERITEAATDLRQLDVAYCMAETLDEQRKVSYSVDVAPEDFGAYSENQWQNIEAGLIALGMDESSRREFYLQLQ